MEVVKLTKANVSRPVFQLVNFDRRTSGVQLRIPMYDSGVDLSELTWTVKIVNAAQESDVDDIAPVAEGEELVYEWIFPPIVAAAVGLTAFEVGGTGEDNEKVWQSGKRFISVIADLDAAPGIDECEYETVKQRVERLEKSVSEAEESVEGLSDRAAEVVDKAEEATGKAEKVIEDTENIYHEVKEAYESGALKGKDGYTPQKGVDYFDGEPGEPGYTPQKNVDYFDGQPGYTPQKGVDYFDGTPGDKGDPGDDGYSPSATVVKTGDKAVITITDKNGTTTAEIKDGQPGEKGDPGVTPQELTKLSESIAEQDRTKVGYSEVVNGQLLMYSGNTKAHLLATLDLPRMASGGKVGMAAVAGTYGTTLVGDVPYIATIRATEAQIDAKTQQFTPIVPFNLEYATMASLSHCANSTLWTDERQAAACQTLGAERAKGEWVLKGTLNDDNKSTGVSLGLAGCTELIIIARGDATTTISLVANGIGETIAYGIFTTSRKVSYLRYEDTPFGWDVVSERYNNTITAGWLRDSTAIGYANTRNKHIADITGITVGSGASSVSNLNIEVYAR